MKKHVVGLAAVALALLPSDRLIVVVDPSAAAAVYYD